MTTYNTPPNRSGLVLHSGDILNVNSGGQSDYSDIDGGTENVLNGGGLMQISSIVAASRMSTEDPSIPR